MSIAKHATITFGTKLISAFFAFISSIFITRLLGAEGKGVLAFINANIALFSSILGFNIMQVLTYFVAKNDFDAAAARGLALLLNMLGFIFFSTAIALLFFFNNPFLDFILPQGYQSLFFVIYLLILFLSGTSISFFHGNWQGQAKFSIINAIVMLSSVLNAVVFTGAWYLKEKELVELSLQQIFSISLIITSSLLLLRIVIFIHSREKISFKIKKVLKPMIFYTGLGWFIGILNFLVRRVDVWFVEYYSGLTELGYYALAASLLDVLLMLLLPATYVLSPYLTKANDLMRVEIMGKFSRISILFFIFICSAIILFSSFIIPFAYGQEFENSIIPTQILFVGGAFILFRNIFAVFNISTNNLKPNLYGVIASLLVTIILDFILIPEYGIIGASIATICAYITSTFIVVSFALKQMNKHIGYFLFFNNNDYTFLKIKIRQQIKKIRN